MKQVFRKSDETTDKRKMKKKKTECLRIRVLRTQHINKVEKDKKQTKKIMAEKSFNLMKENIQDQSFSYPKHPDVIINLELDLLEDEI